MENGLTLKSKCPAYNGVIKEQPLVFLLKQIFWSCNKKKLLFYDNLLEKTAKIGKQ